MPSPSERRNNKRVPVRIPVGIYRRDKPHDVIDAEILDISEGGAFIHCTSKIPLGTEILLEIRFAETKVLEGKVIEHEDSLKTMMPSDGQERSVIRWTRLDEEPGFGIQFLSLKPETKRFLQRLVLYFEQLQSAGVMFKRTSG